MNSTTLKSLGRSGIAVSALGLGCWAIGGRGWGEVSDDESVAALRRGLELGVNFFDTADVYGLGRSERVLARALEGRRQDAVIATKFGYSFDESSQEESGPNASPDYIKKACEDSLRRLNTDYIDLYQFHINEYDPAQAGEVRDTLETLVAEGKIRAYGWSTDFPAGARVFAEGPNCTAIQVNMNALEDAPEIIAVCEEFNLASINRGPLAMGLLTGKFNADSRLPAGDIRSENIDWLKYFKDGKPNPEWLAKLDAIRDILTSGGRTPTQGALAWLWARTPQNVPIPGVKTVAQAEENCGAMQFGPLTPEQMGEIDGLLGR